MDSAELIAGLERRERRILARCITLAESTKADHRRLIAATLAGLPPVTGSIRIGISGAPGVGKSTFIDAFGTMLIEQGHRVAVLAVDPSSQRTGGSILGDKTRMPNLSAQADAFIRPSPAGSTLGGVARRTGEAIVLCEAAGFDVILVETVGVGQSEIEVSNITDLLLLLVAPGGGDDLQGIKRGVMELADVVVVNKADGDLLPAARRTAADYANALHLLRPKFADHPTLTLMASGQSGEGLDTVWAEIESFHDSLTVTGRLEQIRSEQAVRAMWEAVRHGLIEQLAIDKDETAAIEAEVRGGRRSPLDAARALVDRALPD